MSSTHYLRVGWTSGDPDEPVLLWSHVVDGWEVRKVDEYADGRLAWADADHATGSTMLGQAPMPSPEEIAVDPQFAVEVVNEATFELVWAQARAHL
ncbi:DUF6881 domain-containing protein [Microbacterium sp. NPDC058389]|uniref:DUF6881 domain-containing protein n=1 Tax=Microbacterium sp. NPDC058389 TaxID=3346475 RepID=UPI003658D298